MSKNDIHQFTSGTITLWFRRVNTGELEIEIYDSHEPNMPTGSVAAYLSPKRAIELAEKLHKFGADCPAQAGKGGGEMSEPFKNVPIENVGAWIRVRDIAYNAIYKCGHPRGGCPKHCDLFVKIHSLAVERLQVETTPPVAGTPPQDTEKVIAKLLFKRYYNDDPDQSGVCANCGHHCPSENDMQHHPGCPAIDFAASRASGTASEENSQYKLPKAESGTVSTPEGGGESQAVANGQSTHVVSPLISSNERAASGTEGSEALGLPGKIAKIRSIVQDIAGNPDNSLSHEDYKHLSQECADLSAYLDSISESFAVASSEECTALLARVCEALAASRSGETQHEK